MVVVSPTYSDQRWGPDPWCLFDYYQHPTRDTGGNPCIFVRHTGGGTGGDYRDYRNVSVSRFDKVLRWLQDVSHTYHFDYCAFSSGQRVHSGSVAIPRSREILFPDAIFDCQRAISSIKHLSRVYGFRPDICVGFGQSHGATLLGLSHLYPLMQHGGGNTTATRAGGRYATHDSRLRGVVYQVGQPDCRTGVLNYDLVSGWFGTRSDSDAETSVLSNELLAASSLIAHFENGDHGNYRRMYIAYGSGVGAGTKPYTDPHDSHQLVDLVTAIQAKGLSYVSRLYGPTDLASVTDAYPITPTPGSITETIYNEVYQYLVDCIT